MVWETGAGRNRSHGGNSIDESPYSTEQLQRLGLVLRFFFLVQWWIACTALLLRTGAWIVSRLLFLNYDKSGPIHAGDIGWQCVRVFLVGALAIWIAIRHRKERNKRLIRVGSSRFQRPQKRATCIRIHTLCVCLMVANAHMIDTHRSICLKNPQLPIFGQTLRFGSGDIIEDSVIDDYIYDIPIDANEAIEIPPLHRWT